MRIVTDARSLLPSMMAHDVEAEPSDGLSFLAFCADRYATLNQATTFMP